MTPKHILAMALVTLAAGCATLSPVHPVANASGAAQVVLKRRDNDLFKLEVFNTGSNTIVVDRDAITLQAPGQIQHRRPGGASATYVIPPGARHAVNVKFDLGGLSHGDPVWIDFHDAIYVDGEPVPTDALELRVD